LPFGLDTATQTRRNRYGRGLAIFVPNEDVELRKALRSLTPEVQFDNPDPELTFVHRGDQSRDVYFLANLSASGRTFQATFRDGNGSPEFWDPMTGKISLAPIFTRGSAGTTSAGLPGAPWVNIGSFRWQDRQSADPIHQSAAQFSRCGLRRQMGRAGS